MTRVAGGAGREPVRGRARRLGWVAGGLLLAAYACPLLAPPGSAVVASDAPADLLARLFPGVPAAWVLARLAALALGAAVLASMAGRPALRTLPPAADPPACRAPAVGIALAVLVAQAIASACASHLGPLGDLAWGLALLVPALALRAGERDPGRAASLASGVGAGVAALVALWLLWRVGLAWHASRAADPVDLWEAQAWLVDTVLQQRGVLAASGQPGIQNAYMIGLGAPVFALAGVVPSVAVVQAIHGAWLAATALVVAWLAARIVSREAALVAAAGFLAAPFVLLMTLVPAPFGIYLFLAAAIAALLLAWAESRRLSTLTALGAAAGFAATTAYLYHLVGLAGGAVAILLLRRRPRPAWPHWLLPALAFLAAAGPALPDPDALRGLSGRYLAPQADFAALEALLLEQRSPLRDVEEVWHAGRPGPFDVALGSLLSPFAAPRTSIRLWGDAILDPVTASLAAVGIACGVRRLRRDAAAAVLLGALAAALLPGTLTSAYDRASLTRNLGMPIAAALLAAFGFESIRTSLPGVTRRRAAGLAAAAMLAGGAILFDVVNPRLLPASARALAIEALAGARPSGGAVLLEHGRPYVVDWLRVAPIATALPREPIPVRPWLGPRSLYDEAGRPPEVLLWSPGLELDERIGPTICERFPHARFFRLRDRAGVSEAFAARLGDSAWVPGLPAARRIELGCDAVRVPRAGAAAKR